MRNGYSISWHNYKYSFESMPNLFLSSKRQLVVFLRFHDHFVHRFYSNRMYLHLRLWYCLVTACYCYFIPVKSISDLCVLFFYFGFFFDSLSILYVCVLPLHPTKPIETLSTNTAIKLCEERHRGCETSFMLWALLFFFSRCFCWCSLSFSSAGFRACLLSFCVSHLNFS